MAPVPLTCGDAELVRAALSTRRPWSFKAALLSEVLRQQGGRSTYRRGWQLVM